MLLPLGPPTTNLNMSGYPDTHLAPASLIHGGFPIQGMVWGPRLKIRGACIARWSIKWSADGRVLPSHSEYYMALPWWMPCGQGSWSQFQGYWDWCFPSCWWFDIHCITRDQSPVPSFDAWTVSVFVVIWMLECFCWFVLAGMLVWRYSEREWSRVDHLPCCAKRNYKRTLQLIS